MIGTRLMFAALPPESPASKSPRFRMLQSGSHGDQMQRSKARRRPTHDDQSRTETRTRYYSRSADLPLAAPLKRALGQSALGWLIDSARLILAALTRSVGKGPMSVAPAGGMGQPRSRNPRHGCVCWATAAGKLALSAPGRAVVHGRWPKWGHFRNDSPSNSRQQTERKSHEA